MSRPADISPSPTAAASTATPTGSSATLNCGDRGRDFSADALSGPGTAELGTDLAAAILRSTIATAPEETPFPEHGWHRVLDDARGAWFVAAGDDRTPWWQITVGDFNGVLQATEYGACHLSNTAPSDDVSLGRWWLDPAAEAPSADTREVSILVRETDCASGHSPEGRVLPATFVVRDDAIDVTLAIRRRPGDQDCPANPAYSMRLELPEVLGTRRLFDASWYPPRLATTQDPG
ncbi:MAG: hypothetical protein ACXWXR_05115 [Candidatus Limnocylindrales bacterium]